MIEALHLFTHRLGVDRDFAHCPEPSHLLIDLPPLGTWSEQKVSAERHLLEPGWR